MSTEDVYDFEDMESYNESNDYCECQVCFSIVNDPIIIKEFGYEWLLCPNCGGECL